MERVWLVEVLWKGRWELRVRRLLVFLELRSKIPIVLLKITLPSLLTSPPPSLVSYPYLLVLPSTNLLIILDGPFIPIAFNLNSFSPTLTSNVVVGVGVFTAAAFDALMLVLPPTVILLLAMMLERSRDFVVWRRSRNSCLICLTFLAIRKI